MSTKKKRRLQVYGRDEHKGNVQAFLWPVCVHGCKGCPICKHPASDFEKVVKG